MVVAVCGGHVLRNARSVVIEGRGGPPGHQLSKCQWFSGKIQRCHRWAPSSILGSRISFVDFATPPALERFSSRKGTSRRGSVAVIFCCNTLSALSSDKQTTSKDGMFELLFIKTILVPVANVSCVCVKINARRLELCFGEL